MDIITPYHSAPTDVMTAVHSEIEGKNYYSFFCPACKTVHKVDMSWGILGVWSKPTISRSVKVTGVRDLTEQEEMDVLAGRDVDLTPKEFVCHSQVTNGMISYYADSTHPFKGQAMTMPYVLDPEWVAYRERFNVPFSLPGK